MKPLVILFLGILGDCLSARIRLDTSLEESNVWIGDSCAYSDKYKDFWVYGCSREPNTSPNPSTTGFWTSCFNFKQCHIQYHGGSLRKPSKLIITTYIEGNEYIDIWGKNSIDDPDNTNYFGYINAQPTPGWCHKEIDLSEFPETEVLDLTITDSRNGFVLLDKVEVDLGDAPLESPTLDKIEDEYEANWHDDGCHYAEETKDFWVWGCPYDIPENPDSPDSQGFWSPCVRETCTFEFSASPSILATSATVQFYATGDARIEFLSTKGSMPVVTHRKNVTAAGWDKLDWTVNDPNSVLKIRLVQPENSVLIVDQLSVGVAPSNEEPEDNPYPVCQEGPVSTTTDSTSDNPTGPTEPTDPGDDNTGTSISTSFLLITFLYTVLQLF